MNQEIVTENAEFETLPPAVEVGQRLRAAREALGLSRDDVARELRLNEKLIGALEEGDRSQLPPATFISGYLRAYGRLLGLSPEQLISDYLEERVAPSLYRTTDRSGVQMVTSRDPKFRLATYTIMAVLALLFSAWWVNQRFDFISLEPRINDEAELEVAAALPEPSPLLDYEPAAEIETLAAGGAAESVADAASPTEQQGMPLPTPVIAANNKSESASAQVAVPPTAEGKPEPKPEPKQLTVTTEQLPATTPQSLLRLEYQAASWTQVEDANGRVLLYEVVRPGRKLELRGVAPFKVFLGYAPGVLLYYNGNLFPHSAYQRGDLARFRVGSSADNRPLDR